MTNKNIRRGLGLALVFAIRDRSVNFTIKEVRSRRTAYKFTASTHVPFDDRDVVMSVDSDHRYQFCKLLKSQFPDTQFIITTHDRLWAEQMRSAGLGWGHRSIE